MPTASALHRETSGGGPRHLGWTLTLLALAQLLYGLDLNIVFVALPEIGQDLGFPGQTQQLVVSAYVVFAGGFLLFGGRAADLLGRRRVFVTALCLYALASLAGGLAGSPEVIIVARAVQGVGGALLLPSTLSLINTLFEEGPRRNRALAVWGGAGASGLTIGALLGGVLTENFGWPAVFYVNVPVGGLIALCALFAIPRDPARTTRRRFDLPGSLSVTGAATLLVFALVEGPELGWGDGLVVGAFILAALLLALFAAIETRSADPLMPFRLFRNRNLSIGMLVTFLYMATFGVLPYFLTVLMQSVHGYSALQTGIGFLIPSLAIATGTQLGERLASRIGTRTTLITGFGTGAVGTVALAFGFDADAGYGLLVPGLIVSGVGQGVVWTAMWIAAATGTAPQEQGVANGIASTALNIGNAIGLALFTVVAAIGTEDRTGQALKAATADGGFTVVLLTAAGMVVGLLVTLILKRHPAPAPTPDDAAALAAR
ncbi:MFS transporter [Goodfellowiella coeruleoviolacea]|uniref:Drug resistance transporter, EmrB/QacA subfamily n=1 Tax=Goodfellowiella coeruleoviolacea TaxID=334858 RepID=A0AAE3G7N0_9PSEU|nr:MFS transporter [Goodfellowiella coeruleoviolacea]MCP2163216.1 drug resistance transporter, EmrB/QacA subfamily [Goodfellowiella coeruleoviolacea]